MNWINNRMPPKHTDVLIRFPGPKGTTRMRYTVGWHDGDRWCVQHKAFREGMEIAWVQIEED